MAPNDTRFTVVGLGEVLWDVLPGGKQLGGAPANFAYHAQALGARGLVVSCVGDDDLGREIMQALQKVSLDTRYVAVDREHPTGTVTVELDEQGKPEYVIHEDVAWDFMPFEAELETLSRDVDAVCFGTLSQRSAVSRDTVRRFLETTRPECLRIYDINLRQSYYSRDVVENMLGRSNVLKLNDEELPIVASLLRVKGSEYELLEQLRRHYDLRLIVLTKGAKGSILFSQGQTSVCRDAKTIAIADTVGAGDTFTAAVAMGVLRGRELGEINEVANRLASYVCTQKGATPAIPSSLLAELV